MHLRYSKEALWRRWLFYILLDSISFYFLIKQSCLPQGVALKEIPQTKFLKLSLVIMAQYIVTPHGINSQIMMNTDDHFTKRINVQQQICCHDMILAPIFLKKIKLDYVTGQMPWYVSTLSMHPHKGLTSDTLIIWKTCITFSLKTNWSA